MSQDGPMSISIDKLGQTFDAKNHDEEETKIHPSPVPQLEPASIEDPEQPFQQHFQPTSTPIPTMTLQVLTKTRHQNFLIKQNP